MSQAKQCPACGGRGTVAFATEVVTCSTCNGKGTVGSGGSDADKK